ncbi:MULTISPECIES: hypothetical protein [unclassified Kitasatospora]|uniref:hypothetical protein n=1 Tax=unclassified Kitasatospora TaxID=2633591 RepID=UPI00070FBA12|nr:MULTISPECIES: hypothetical protein [unclassified Kitasatospora]KQV21786.1 hypothetical protein ASC99_19055 [Kitasatospora sp. Root107]KRB75422.1 hypothetical protein ASE03_15700 [Kitasatospora sp. Root187]
MSTFDPALIRPAALASAGAESLPVLPALAGLLPGGGLRAGTVVSVVGDAGLLVALAAGAAAEESGVWTAAVGLPDLGLAAAAGYGVELERLLLVDRPGAQWPEVVSALAGAVGLVLLGTDGAVPPQLAARLAAVLRRSGCVLLVAGPWPGAVARLRVAESRWFGVGDGHGQLTGRQALVVAEGRGAGGRARTAWLWLPDEHGAVRAVEAGEQAGNGEVTGAVGGLAVV